MKKHPSSTTGRRLLPGLFILLLIAANSIFYSCGNGKDQPMGGGTPGQGEYAINCLKLNYEQVKTWVDSGWLRQGGQILFQFYSADVSMSHNNTQLIAYPGDSPTTVRKAGKQVLANDTTCTGLKITGGAILSNIQGFADKLDIFNTDGTLKKFDYIRLIPVRFSKDNDYISFRTEKIVDGKPDVTGKYEQPPCPPYCCPPDCEDQ